MFFLELLYNKAFIAVALSNLSSQLIKAMIKLKNKSKPQLSMLLDTGGMPSTHSASVSALTAAVAILNGPNLLFIACLVFSAVVIRDALGVRNEVDVIKKDIKASQNKSSLLKPESIKKSGHTLGEVIAGIALGTGFAVAVCLW